MCLLSKGKGQTRCGLGFEPPSAGPPQLYTLLSQTEGVRKDPNPKPYKPYTLTLNPKPWMSSFRLKPVRGCTKPFPQGYEALGALGFRALDPPNCPSSNTRQSRVIEQRPRILASKSLNPKGPQLRRAPCRVRFCWPGPCWPCRRHWPSDAAKVSCRLSKIWPFAPFFGSSSPCKVRRRSTGLPTHFATMLGLGCWVLGALVFRSGCISSIFKLRCAGFRV